MRVVNEAMYANPLAQKYRRAFDDAANAPEAYLRIHTDVNSRPAGGAAAGAHGRQYNAPTADSVAVILHAPGKSSCHDVIVHRKEAPLLTSTSKQVKVSDDGRVGGQRVTWLTSTPDAGTYTVACAVDGSIGATVRLADGSAFENPPTGLQRVPYTNSLYDALAFPLLFQRGTPTWHDGFTVPAMGKKRRKVQMLQFYASMMYVRRSAAEMPPARQGVKREIVDNGSTVANDNCWLFRGGRLFQQFVCTAAARVELKRMSTLQTPKMQKQLRAESYDQLKAALRDGQAPADIGRKVICPASVKGSRRAM